MDVELEERDRLDELEKEKLTLIEEVDGEDELEQHEKDVLEEHEPLDDDELLDDIDELEKTILYSPLQKT